MVVTTTVVYFIYVGKKLSVVDTRTMTYTVWMDKYCCYWLLTTCELACIDTRHENYQEPRTKNITINLTATTDLPHTVVFI